MNNKPYAGEICADTLAKVMTFTFWVWHHNINELRVVIKNARNVVTAIKNYFEKVIIFRI